MVSNSIGILFNRKSSKVVKILQGNEAFLKLFAMGNVSASRDYVVFNNMGVCVGYYEGKKGDLPTICHDMEGKSYKDFNITSEQLEELFK